MSQETASLITMTSPVSQITTLAGNYQDNNTRNDVNNDEEENILNGVMDSPPPLEDISDADDCTEVLNECFSHACLNQVEEAEQSGNDSRLLESDDALWSRICTCEVSNRGEYKSYTLPLSPIDILAHQEEEDEEEITDLSPIDILAHQEEEDEEEITDLSPVDVLVHQEDCEPKL
jgi:hypothetical protein